MIRTIIAIVLFLSVHGFCEVPWINGESDPANLCIKVVTFGPGDEMWAWWGHGGIIVEDTLNQESIIYNFGMLDQPPFVLVKFVMQRLYYYVGTSPDSSFLELYRSWSRDIRIQILDLPPEKRLEMARLLALNTLPENKDYLYHHFLDNCTTRMRDLIDDVTDGALYQQTNNPGRMTFRNHARRYLDDRPFLEILIMFLLNDSIDKPIKQWDEIFLPEELEKHLDALSYRDEAGNLRKLVREQYVYFQSDRKLISEDVPTHWPFVLLAGILLGAIPLFVAYGLRNPAREWLMILYGAYTMVIGIFTGLPGFLLTYGVVFTDHDLVYYNENLILSNPLTALFILTGLALYHEKKRFWPWHKRLWIIHFFFLVIAAGLKFLPAFDQDNALIFALLAPLYVMNGVACFMVGSWDKVQGTRRKEQP